MSEPNDWDASTARGDGGVVMVVLVLAALGLVSIVGHVILFAVGALP